MLVLWLVATYLVVGAATRPSPAALALLGGLMLFAGWTWLSIAWSDDVDQSVLEGQRALLYVAAAAALVLLVRREDVGALLAGALAAIAVASGWGLATRLFPDRIGVFEPTGGYRLGEPLGYWNGLGVFAAMGVLLALGFAVRGRPAGRALAAASLPILTPTIYFTFSRGAWIALGFGLLAAVALDPRRLQLLAGGVALAPAPALAVWLASRQEALSRSDAPLSAATREGHGLALYVVLLAAATALVATGLAAAETRFRPGRTARAAFAAGLALVAIAGLMTVFARYGGPITLVEKGYNAFVSPPPPDPADLRKRLFTFTGSYRVDLWEAGLDNYVDHRVLGSGAGSYEHYWNEHRPFAHIVRDAHSLYLETLAELGPIGLAWLVLALAAPLAAALLARGHPLVPAALGAYVAYLAHAGVDWDWELPSVTLAAIACGAALIAAARRDETRPISLPVRGAALAAALGLALIAFVGLVGASALSASEEALERGRYGEAEDEARKAADWWRWSPEPWKRLGDAQLAAGREEAAQESYRKAIEKDRHDWSLWYDLSVASEGHEARRALAETARLNPYFRDDLAEEEAGRAAS